MKHFTTFLMLAALVAFVGCGKTDDAPPADDTGGGDVTTPDTGDQANTTTTTNLPTFTLATSEYPSWSTYVVAGKAGIINPAEGGDYGPLETKYGIDVVIEAKDYDSCIALYGSGTVDAACLTNMDSLNPALGRTTTAILPTSTSAGGDKVIAVGIDSIEGLKGTPIYGLEKSVSQFTVIRGLEKSQQNPADYKFMNLAPEAAATALQTGSNDVKAICVWNPFAIQTLKTTNGSKTVFDSSIIAGEIVDQVIIGNDSLAKPGGEKFATCLCDIFYQVNTKLWNSDTTVQNAAREALKQDFAPDLTLDDMETVLTDTQFYKTAKDGITLYTSDGFKTTMETVVTTCKAMGVLESKTPTIGYNDPNAQLNFTPKYMESVTP